MPGYTSFANLLTRFPELLMVRKFDRLSIRILLYQQAELLYLEKDLDIFIEIDTNKDGLSGIDASWATLNQRFERGDFGLQKKKLNQIQDKLRDYHETLLRVHRIQCLKSPSTWARGNVRDWLSRKEGGNGFLNHVEANPWLPSEEMDLISLQEGKHDRLDEWLASAVTPIYHYLFGHHKQPDVEAASEIGPVWEYKMSAFAALGSLICVVLSCAVPLVSILALYYAHETYLQLILISIFTIIFAGLVGTVAASKRSEVFTATVAFAAVQVVFLQGIKG